MDDYYGMATAEFLRLIKAGTTTELRRMIGADRLTRMQARAITDELAAREDADVSGARP